MYLLTLLIAIPLVGSLLVVASAKFGPRTPRWVALGLSIAGVVVASAAANAWSTAGPMGMVESIRPDGAYSFWSLALDGLSLPLVVLTAVLAVVAVLASWRVDAAPGAHHALLLLLTSATMGVFLAADLVLLYVFWEAVLIPMFFLIGKWGHERRRHAAVKFFIYTFLGSALMLVGLLMVVGLTGTTSLYECYASGGLLASEKGLAAQSWVFWLLAVGFLVKIPAVPLHTWLPDAHVEAPTAGSIMLAGVLLKMGGYGLLRLAIPLAPNAFAEAAPILAGLGIAGILYGALTAMAQKDLKRLVAYSSVAHMGFVLLGIGAGTEAGFGAAMLVMVSHGVVSALLFLLVGLLYDRTHTREIGRYGGLMRTMPAWGMAFSLGALASLGLPGLSGFPGELLSLIEAFGPYGAWLIFALVGLVVSAAFHLWAIRRVNHGEGPAEWVALADLDPRERLAVAPLVVSIVALGVWPGLVLSVTDDAMSLLGALLRSVS